MQNKNIQNKFIVVLSKHIIEKEYSLKIDTKPQNKNKQNEM